MTNDLPASAGADEPSTHATSAAVPELHRYMRYVVHIDLPEARKAEMLRAVWTIMRSFVDRAFGDDAAQLARKDGDEFQIGREADSPSVIGSDDHDSTGDNALSRAFTKGACRANRKERR